MQVFGFVRAILGRDTRHTAPPFVVEIYSPNAQPGERTKRFHLAEVDNNRELVLVSVLRDALVHSLPVELGCDDEGRIDHIEVRTRAFYDEWEKGSVTGKVKGLSIDEHGLGEANQVNPDVVMVVMESGSRSEELYLNLQRSETETKMAQLSLLRHAYENDLDATVSYQNQPLGGGKSVKVIIGVQLGTSLLKTIPIGKGPVFPMP